MLCHCSSTMKNDHFVVKLFGTKWPFCANVLLKPHSLTSIFDVDKSTFPDEPCSLEYLHGTHVD